MPLTPAEQQELDAINAQLAEMDEQSTGEEAVWKAHQARQPDTPPESRPFSTYRAVVGGIRDFAEGALQTFYDLSDFQGQSMTGSDYHVPRLHFPTLEGEDRAGTPERLTRGLISFAVPFTASLKAFRTIGALSALGRGGVIAEGLGAGAVADFTQADPQAGNLANLLTENFGVTNSFVKSLASEQDDGALEARFKATATGALAGLAGEAVLGAGARLARLYRDWRGTAEEAAAVVKNLREGPVKLEPLPPSKSLTVIDNAAAGADNAAAHGPEVIHPDAVYDPVHPDKVLMERQPETFEDVLDFLKAKAGDPQTDPEFLARLAKNLLEGDPENALAKIGIDPAKLDYSVYHNPERLGRLQKGLENIFADIANRLGRTGTTVTARATVRAAEALASTPDVLKNLYGSTSNLAETLMASRLVVGAHAHQLLKLADAAEKEIANGGAGPAWTAFLEAFHRHAYFLGALRGAGSEVGRALRSLQTIAKASPEKARKLFDQAAADEVKNAPSSYVRRTMVETGASSYADSLGSDAEKLAALGRLKALGGDVAELSRHVREGSGTIWGRFNAALKETMGSLFGTATAVYNVGAGVTFMGLNTVGRLLAAVARSPALLLKDGPANAEARRAWIEAWAYCEGALGGFSEAFRNTIAILEKEAYSELAINADGLGLHDLARRAQARSIKGDITASEHFERADVVNRKAFALTTSEARRLHEFASNVKGPEFFQMGLKGLVKVLAGSINAAGSLYRTGTTLFINLPDEFVGTMAARAGKYAQAVRIAAAEAADHGLADKELGQYIKARTVQLVGPDHATALAASADEGARAAMMRAGETEAKSVLFQDDLELGLNRAIQRGVNATGGIGSVFIPFIKTPLRILERTAIDYTPLGLFTDRIRWGIAAGGAARDEALARMSLGVGAVMLAYQLAEDRRVVGYDGGYISTARDTGRPSYSLKIGDDTYEFSRLDPIGTLLGMGADLRAYFDANEDNPNALDAGSEIAKAMIWATAANVLSKTWLTSIRQLTDLAGATSPEDANTRWKKFLQGMGTRAIPASGIQRQLEAWGDGVLRDAASFSDGLRKASLGADTLPPKRDIVGREVTAEGMTRIAGIRGSIMPDRTTDPLGAELESLSFSKPPTDRTQKGVPLNATQYSRFLQIRGQEVRDPRTGLTMAEALNTLVRLPEYQALPKAARIQEIEKAMRGYNGLAVDKLTDEDHSYALARLRVEVFDAAALQGWDAGTRQAKLAEFADKLGIPHD